MKNLSTSRRIMLKSAVFGFIGVSIPNLVFTNASSSSTIAPPNALFHRYPSIDDEVVASVVGASHFDLEKVKKMVNHRPELARATWDWGFGDWETAIGAASHVGRRDIVAFLLSKGARPDIFTYAMLGHFKAVKNMIGSIEDVHKIQGPHGISLLRHAQSGLRMKNLTATQIKNSEKTIAYLEKLERQEVQQEYIALTEDEKPKYLGDYKYGDLPQEGFSIKLNMRKLLSLGKIGKFGGALYQIRENEFIYNGTTSVKISFQFEGDRVVSLTVREPDLTLVAKKVT